MSQINVTTIANQAGTLSVPSETVVAGSAKVWVNFVGSGTVTINDSFNVSSLSDLGVGKYTVNFSSALANSNYAWGGSAHPNSATTGGILCEYSTRSTSALSVMAESDASAAFDGPQVSVIIFGDA